MDVTYLDHNASSPLPQEVLQELGPLAQRSHGNPSSLHRAGRQSRRLINEAAEAVGRAIECDPEFIYWTSGAAEANSWALHSAAALATNANRTPRLIVSTIEHDSTQLAARAAQAQGAELAELRVLPTGQVDLSHLDELLAHGTWDLVSAMHSNNETGVIQPVAEVAAACRARGAPLHVDCVQSFGRLPLSLKEMGATYATFSGHKIGAPKGIGFLAVQGEGRLLWPLVHGKQQKTLRGGTENPMNIGALGVVARALTGDRALFPGHLASWHRDFEAEIKRRIPGAVVHGDTAPRLRNTTFVGFEGIDGDGILMNLDLEGICASSGSACTSGSLDPSHVLLAMGCDKALARSSVRFSSGRDTRWTDFERVLGVLPDIVDRIRTAGKS